MRTAEVIVTCISQKYTFSPHCQSFRTAYFLQHYLNFCCLPLALDKLYLIKNRISDKITDFSAKTAVFARLIADLNLLKFINFFKLYAAAAIKTCLFARSFPLG